MKQSLHEYIKSVGWLRWLFVTKDGQVVIAQVPNVPLIVAFVADILANVLRGEAHDIANRGAQILFAIWAVLEIGWGVNPFRRLLGVVVFGLSAFALLRAIF